MNRSRSAACAVLAAVLLTGCQSGEAPPGDVDVPPSASPASEGPREEATPEPSVVLTSAALVGLWSATDGGAAEIVYRFDPDGTFARVGLLWQERPSGVFKLQEISAGTFTLTERTLTLQPTEGSVTIEDPDAPEGPEARTTPKSDMTPELHSAELRDGGAELVLRSTAGADGTEGDELTFHREEAS